MVKHFRQIIPVQIVSSYSWIWAYGLSFGSSEQGIAPVFVDFENFKTNIIFERINCSVSSEMEFLLYNMSLKLQNFLPNSEFYFELGKYCGVDVIRGCFHKENKVNYDYEKR